MERLLRELLAKKEKSIECNEKFIVTAIKFISELDQIILNLRQNDTIYEGLVMIKGTIFPIPKLFSVLSINRIYLKYDEEFILKIFIEGEIDSNTRISELDNSTTINSYSFGNNIIKTISILTKINVLGNNSNVFKVIKLEENKIIIKSILESKASNIEIMQSQNNNFNLNDFIWICNYEVEQGRLKTNELTTIEILEDDKLINFLDNTLEGTKILFQVIDMDKENIILFNKNKNIYKLKKNQTALNNKIIDFCMTIIISNYNIKNNNEIELNDDSFIHTFKLESYYIENIIINLIVVLEIHFIDFKKDNNIYDCITSSMFDEKKIITKNIEHIYFDSIIRKKYEYYPIDLTLSSSKNENIKSTFSLYIYPALMNKINAFLNVKDKNLYYYEYLYYNISDNLEEIQKEIIVNDLKYNITINDNFGSKNRKRISIMNIPYQKCEFSENEMRSRSVQICELINKGFKRIIGIYNIKIEFKEIEKSNDYFDEYYESFGDIYDIIKSNNSRYYDDIEEKLENKLIKYELIKNKNQINILNTNNFYESMTLSQFKSWFGLVICEFANKSKSNQYKVIDVLSNADKILYITKDKRLKYKDIIRILIFALNQTLIKKINIKPKFISELNKISPFFLAYDFNKNQIMRLGEFSALFQAYLQLDSYKAYNYIHSEYTYTFSLELVFMIKYQLLSTYEEFFFTKHNQGKEYAFIDYNTKITVINMIRTFGENFKESVVINNINTSKNYAMPLSLHFMHEKSGHYKYSLKNNEFQCPIIYFRGLRIEIEISNNRSIGEFYGESGRIIENFICKNKFIINQLSSNFIFGDFFAMEYFDVKDFSKLIEAVKSKLAELNINIVEEENSVHYIKNFEENVEKNKIEEEKIENLTNIIQDGDVEYDLDEIRREKAMTEKEKKEREEKSILMRKNIIKNLKMRKMKNN